MSESVNNKPVRTKDVMFYYTCMLLALQVVFMIYTNFFCIPDTMDNDSAKVFLHAMEIWKTKSLFIDSWINQTTLELDCPLLLAVPIYGICHNIFVSFGIANLMIAGFTAYIFYRILKRMSVSLNTIILTVAFLFIPFSFGQLLYYNMTFFAAGQYAIKALLPLLLLDLLTDTSTSVARVPLGIIACLLSLVCGISSGVYVFITGLAPCILCYIWFEFLATDTKSLKERITHAGYTRLLICFLVTVCTLIGAILSRIHHVGSETENTTFTSIFGIIDSLLASISSWFELIGTFPYQKSGLISINTIGFVIKIIFVIVTLIVLFVSIRDSFRGFFTQPETTSDKSSATGLIRAGLVAIVLFNFGILWMTAKSDQPRYFIGVFYSVLILTGYHADGFLRFETLGTYQKNCLKILIFGALAVMTLVSDRTVLKGDCFPAFGEENANITSLIGEIADEPESLAVMLNDTSAAEILRVLDYDSGRIWLAYKTEADEFNPDGLVVNDYYSALADATALDSAHIMIVNTYTGSLDMLPEYIRNTYHETGRSGNYIIYKSDVNRMDGPSGPACSDHTKDYCYSRDYTIYSGQIGPDGKYYATGADDVILASPYLGRYPEKLTVSMHYSGSGDSEEIGLLELRDGTTHELVASSPIVATNNGTVSIDSVDVSQQEPVVNVILKSDCDIIIDYFEYTRQ